MDSTLYGVYSQQAYSLFKSDCRAYNMMFLRCRKVRREWQEDQWADHRRDKEEAAARYRRKQEERQRQKEELEKRKKEKDQERIDGAKGQSR